MNKEKYYRLISSHPELFSNKQAYIKIITDKKIILKWEHTKKLELKKKEMPEEWGDIGVVYENPYIIILRDLVEFPDGYLGSYFRLINSADINDGHAVAVLPIMNHKIVLLNQFRHATRKWHKEIPRGFGEPHVSAEQNVKKEISEEISGEISDIFYLGPYNSNTGIEGVTVELFLAELEKIGIVNTREGIKSFELFTIKEMEEMIRTSIITDGFTIAAFVRAKANNLIKLSP